ALEHSTDFLGEASFHRYADAWRACSIRSEEHTSELQSRLVISYAVFCLKKKTDKRLHSVLPDHLRSALRGFEFVFFFNDTATTEIYTTRHTLSLHDALPIGLARLFD